MINIDDKKSEMAFLEWVKNANKKAGRELAQIDVKKRTIEKIPFTSLRLSYASYGGVPIGRWVEFYGEESSGKSTAALDIMANYQKLHPNRVVMYVDIEGTYDPAWAKNMGFDSSKNFTWLEMDDGTYAEEVFNLVKAAMETGAVGLVVLDSIGAMFSKQASEKDFDEKTYGGIASALTQFVNQCTPLLTRNQICFIGINQVRENIGNIYNPVKTPGGNAWKFACSQRYMFRRGRYLDEKGNEVSNSCENPQGHVVEVKLIKSKTCPSDRRIAKCSFFYRRGFAQDIDLLDLAIKFDIVHKSGAWFTATINGNEYKWQGQGKVLEALNTDNELLESLKSMVSKLLDEHPEKDDDEYTEDVDNEYSVLNDDEN